MRIKRRRQSEQCLDCGQALDKNYNFCPACGQENDDQQTGIITLVGDFLSNYFALDSRLGKSIRHFFFRPGFLTLQYNAGKRVRYIHPLRLYLVISVFFFFILQYMLSIELEDNTLSANVKKSSKPEVESSAEVAAAKQHLKEVNEAIPDSSGRQLADSITTAVEDSRHTFTQIYGWMRDESLTDQMVLDSLGASQAERTSANSLFVFKQARRIAQKDIDVFVPYVLKNLPIMMFMLLPFFALFLMFLFRNKPNLYIGHIIHALHIHSMVFLLLSIFLLIGWTTGHYFYWTVFILITLYAFFSIKKVYQQRWLRTSFKFIVLGGLYFNTLLIFFLLEMTWSFLTF